MSAAAQPYVGRRGQPQPHGTRARYLSGCRCDECRAANGAYLREYKTWRKEYGRRTVPVGKVRQHVEALMASGIEVRAICTMSGVAPHTLNDLLRGRSKRVREGTADNLLAVQPGDWAGNARVPAAVAVDLLDKIVEAGVQQKDIAAAWGYRFPHLNIRYRQFVTQRTYRRLLVVAAHVGVLRPFDVHEMLALAPAGRGR